MLIQTLEQKTRLALTTVVLTVVGCAVVCVFTVFYAFNKIESERHQVYILDGDIPFLAQRASLEANFVMESKAHIRLFHRYFFTLPPDDSYIKWTLNKAMYMADETALKQKKALEENGFYSDLVSSSATCMITCDSIQFNEEDHTFKYFGTQFIKRRSKDVRRSITTTGRLESIPRTENNPHGLLIKSWKTIENKDLRY